MKNKKKDKKKKYDFSGYVTKADVLCADGRIIKSDAFKHSDGARIPLLWQHLNTSPTNVLGHCILENRADGVYGYSYLNDSKEAKHAKEMIMHGDVNSYSIYANNLVQNGNFVLHGDIKEVSLVLSGANPEAKIDNISFSHSAGGEYYSEEEAIITFGETLKHSEEQTQTYDEEEDFDPDDIYDTMNDKQKALVDHLAGLLMDEKQETEDIEEETIEHSDKGEGMKKNVFDKSGGKDSDTRVLELKHSDYQAIFDSAKEFGSLKKACDNFLQHNATYGIKEIEQLFPNPQDLNNPPEFIKRDTTWVSAFLGSVRKVPFTNIRTRFADITEDEARAKGYIKGNLKKEEVFSLLKRETTPCTVYKKQKLDRDDILDIKDFNVVSWIKQEMEIMLDEEIARACLLSDGREASDPDRINREKIRPIIFDHELFTVRKKINAGVKGVQILDEIMMSMLEYKGTGKPTLYISPENLLTLLLLKDKDDRRLFTDESDLAKYLRVAKIVEVELMSNFMFKEKDFKPSGSETQFNLLYILVNPADYTIGGRPDHTAFFDDFDIDYNQYKYLKETRAAACLVKPKSAIVLYTEG